MRLEDVPPEVTLAPEPPVPPLADLWRGRARGWLRYHVAERVAGNAEVLLYRLFQRLHPAPVAWIGRRLGRLVGILHRNRPYMAHVRRAIRLIRPGITPAETEALIAEWWRQTGTSHALFPVLRHLAGPERLRIVGAERIAEAEADPRATFFLMVHLGSWELIGHAYVRHYRRPGFAIWQPQPSRYQNRLIAAERLDFGIRAFRPHPLLPKILVPLVEAGTHAALFIDEVSEARCKFPLWGGPLPKSSNLLFSLRLAHRAGARLQPCHFVREGGWRHALHLLEPVVPPGELPREDWVAWAARALSERFEPVIRAHLPQWYMLKDMRLPPDAEG
jgi:KDO2-lipid IV(A) lauroyltransferase